MATTALHSPVTTPPGYTDTAKVRDMAALFRLRAKDAVSASTTARLCRLAVILHYRRTGDEMLDLDTSLINWPRVVADIGPFETEQDLKELSLSERRSLDLAWAHRSARPADVSADQLNPSHPLDVQALTIDPPWPLSA